jgi:hypothetical protein
MPNTDPLDDLLELTADDEVTSAPAADTNLDDLLDDVTNDVKVVEEPKPEPKKRAPRKPRVAATRDPEEVVNEPGHIPTETINPTESETPEQRRIRELQAELAKPILRPTSDAAGRPLPESELDAEQRQIRQLEDAVARRKAEALSQAEQSYVEPSDDAEVIHIHFLQTGLLVNGATTYRGQEMKFEVGGLAHRQTMDRNGNSFLDLVDDIDGQWDRYGKQYFARGPWRGRKWDDVSTITDPQARLDAEAAARAEARRGFAAPVTAF